MPTPTKSTTRTRKPSSAPSGRFARPGQAASRPRTPSRIPSVPGRAAKSKSKSKSKSGMAGLLSSLPAIAGSAAKGRSGGSATSKAKPAVAMLAAGAGALLGRKQMQKRKGQEPEALVTTPPIGNGAPPSVSGT